MTKSRDLANAATALNAVTAAELGFVDGVTSAIQTQMDTKLATATAATTYVPNSLADAKGDLFVATADNTVTRLPVSTQNGDTIVADSSTSTGLRYTAGTVQSNPVLNSAMQNWQRGTSFAITTPFYTADRWQGARGANTAGSTITRQVTGDTTNLPSIQYCLRQSRDSGNTATNPLYLTQSFESINSIPFAGKTVTISFYARKGANFSAASDILSLALSSGTGTDQNLLTAGYTGSSTVASNNFALTSTWQRFTMSGTVPATATEIGLLYQWTPVGTAGAADFCEVTGVQLDIGSVALPFRTYAGTIQGELAACQRYYFRTQTGTGAGYFGVTVAGSATTTYGNVIMKQTMRTSPTSIDFSGLMWQAITSSGNITNATISGATPENVILNCTTTGATAAVMNYLAGQSNTAYVGFSAEL